MATFTTRVLPSALRHHSAASVLKAATVADVLGPGRKPIVRLSLDSPLSEVYKTLAGNSVLSAPVLDPKTRHYYGFVDVLDLVAYLAEYNKFDPKGFAIAEYYNTPVDKAMSGAGAAAASAVARHPVIEMPKTASLIDVFEVMGRTHAHRIAITDPACDSADHVSAVLTQSDVIRWLEQHISQFEDPKFMFHPSKTLGDLGFGGPSDKKVVVVLEDKKTIDCFSQLHETGVSALGVVDATGKLVGSISAGDLRGITQESFAQLQLPVKQFLAARTRNFAVAHLDTKFSDALHVIVQQRLHRIFLVDAEMRPLTTISLGDIINLFTVLKKTEKHHF